MKYLIISTIFVLVYGRSEPAPGYKYSSPKKSNITSYEAPLSSIGPLPTIKVANASESTNSSRSVNSSQASSITIHKHIYVHSPPSEIEVNHRPRVHFKPPPPHKHYKIIFIKAPTPLAPRVSHIPAVRQSEEKTLVYVLTEKLGELNNNTPTVAPVQPSRPEVYFINYQSRKEKADAKGLDKMNEVSAYYGAPNSRTRPSSGGNSVNSTTSSSGGVSAHKGQQSPKSHRTSGPY